MGMTGPTNVLSFHDDPGPGQSGLVSGQIALSIETLRRETFLYGQELMPHCMRLLCHAMLHLANYEHGEDMDALTDRALADLAPHLYKASP